MLIILKLVLPTNTIDLYHNLILIGAMKRRSHLGRFKLCDMIERDEVYKDYAINNAACLILN